MSGGEPPTASSFEVVRSVYAAAAGGDPEAFLAHFDDDAVVEQWPGLPWVNASGQANIRAFAERASSYISSRQHIDELFIAGDEVVAIGRSRGEAVRTGRGFDVRIVHRWLVRDGRIRRWELLVDTGPLLDALDERDARAE
jgi:ketosteroid isomerase-like protein